MIQASFNRAWCTSSNGRIGTSRESSALLEGIAAHHSSIYVCIEIQSGMGMRACRRQSFICSTTLTFALLMICQTGFSCMPILCCPDQATACSLRLHDRKGTYNDKARFTVHICCPPPAAGRPVILHSCSRSFQWCAFNSMQPQALPIIGFLKPCQQSSGHSLHDSLSKYQRV